MGRRGAGQHARPGAQLTYEVAIASEQLALDHWDPADRFIAATAKVLDATPVTADARLIDCAVIKVMVNL
mgnify:CR=1 FL=1